MINVAESATALGRATARKPLCIPGCGCVCPGCSRIRRCCLASLAWPGLADRGREGPGLGLACARGDGWSREDAGSSLELQPPEIMPSLAHTLTAPRVVARMTDAGCYSITSLGFTALSLGGGIQRRISQPGNFNPKSSRTAQREQARGSFCLQLRLSLPSEVRAVAFVSCLNSARRAPSRKSVCYDLKNFITL